MTDYLTEQEQVELLKSWVKQYSLVILMGVMLAIIAISGWRYWQQRESKVLSHASSVYDELLTLRAQNNTEGTLIQANKLFSHYRRTTYGQMAALMLARDAVIKKNYSEAEKHLTWVLDHSHVPAFRQIARIRLARLKTAEHQANAALTLLERVDDKTFSGLIDEVRGDAYLELKQIPMARDAYGLALKELPNAEVIRPLLQMKYDNLATASA